MLKKFEVENYMGFKNNFVFDFSTNKKYKSNKDFIGNGIIKKTLIYGKNSSGKSNLCSALMDISFHLTENEKILVPNIVYLNADNNSNYAIFKYHFKFGKKNIVYEYAKSSCVELGYEKLYLDEELILEYNYSDQSHNITKIPGTEYIIKSKFQQQLSCIKYIYNNTVLDDKSPIKLIIDFVKGMLYFKNLLDGNRYMGYRLGSEDLASIILKDNKLKDFQDFLQKHGLNYNLVPISNINGQKLIGIKFSTGKVIEFSQIISSGTKTLWLFYCWSLSFKNLKMLIIDEFDAYYHHKLSSEIIKHINNFSEFQTVITTHNTFLMKHEIIRPDCCFIIEDCKTISPLCNLTKKELREQHNFEKMYRDDLFNT